MNSTYVHEWVDFAVDEVIRHNKRTEGQATKGAW